MSRKNIQNIAASIRQKLLNKAKESNRPFNEMLRYYAMERFLYRISKSPHSKNFILKGALMFTVWGQSNVRSTMDIDLLGTITNDPDNITKAFQSICDIECESDGLIFDKSSVTAEQITVDADYQGIRLHLNGNLENARIRIQVDIGFSDVIIPGPEVFDYPTILDLPAPALNCYTKETIIAEKFQAMIKLDLLNSRMKDFYDILVLAGHYEFNGIVLRESIVRTFQRRKTEIRAKPTVLTEEFSLNPDKITQWKAFLRKNDISDVPENYKEVIHVLTEFLKPIIDSIVKNKDFDKVWQPIQRTWA